MELTNGTHRRVSEAMRAISRAKQPMRRAHPITVRVPTTNLAHAW